MRHWVASISLFILALIFPTSITAQSDLVAVVTVQNAGVEVQRVETDSWVSVDRETIVNVGDTIRTDGNGRALVTFFDDGIDTDIEPNTTYRIDTFRGNPETYDLSVSLLLGQTRQRIGRALDAGSNYTVETPGITLVARGTIFDVRVDANGRTAMLVSEGTVNALSGDESADVTVGFGIREQLDGRLSAVVPANTFDELGDALEGESVSSGPGSFDRQVLTRPMFVRPLYNSNQGASDNAPIANAGGTYNDGNGSNQSGGEGANTNNTSNGNQPEFNSINPAGKSNNGGNGNGNGNDGTNGGGNGNGGGNNGNSINPAGKSNNGGNGNGNGNDGTNGGGNGNGKGRGR